MDWFLYDNGLRHERVKIRLQIRDNSPGCELVTNLTRFIFTNSYAEQHRKIKFKVSLEFAGLARK